MRQSQTDRQPSASLRRAANEMWEGHASVSVQVESGNLLSGTVRNARITSLFALDTNDHFKGRPRVGRSNLVNPDVVTSGPRLSFWKHNVLDGSIRVAASIVHVDIKLSSAIALFGEVDVPAFWAVDVKVKIYGPALPLQDYIDLANLTASLRNTVGIL